MILSCIGNMEWTFIFHLTRTNKITVQTLKYKTVQREWIQYWATIGMIYNIAPQTDSNLVLLFFNANRTNHKYK